MSMEDKTLAMMVRKMIVKSPLDITMLQVTSRRGIIELTGSVRKPSDHKGATMDLKAEMKKLVAHAKSTRGVTDVYADNVRLLD
jgi:hypothetical protein